MDAVIFPINIGNAHWTAAAINFEKKRFEYYDSMGDLTSSRQRTFKAGIHRTLREVLTASRNSELISMQNTGIRS